MATFSERLRTMRKHVKMNQTELAKKVGLAQKQISDYERGVSPKPDIIAKLADALQTTANYLVGQTDDPKPLSPDERKIVDAYRIGDQTAIDDLFGKQFDDLLSSDPTLRPLGQ